jgi:hypothetical protein
MKPLTASRRLCVALTAVVALASGCSQVVRQSYEGDPASSTLKLSAYSGSTAVYGTTDPESDSRKLVADSYARLGVSTFKSDHQVTNEEIKSEANDVGADIVLFSARIPGTRQFIAPVALDDNKNPYNLAPYTQVTPVAVPAANYAGATSVGTTVSNGSVTTTTVTPVNSPVAAASNQEYEYTLSFWRKATTG